MASTFRQTVADGLFGLLEDFKTAAPTRLPGGVFRKRPGGFADTTLAYVGPRNETITHSNSVRTRTMVPSVVFAAARRYDEDVANDPLDAAVDEFVDYATQWPYAVSSNFPISPSQVEDVELDIGGGITIPATVVTFSNGRPGGGGVSIQEGRR